MPNLQPVGLQPHLIMCYHWEISISFKLWNQHNQFPLLPDAVSFLYNQDRIIMLVPTTTKADKQRLICLKQSPWTPRHRLWSFINDPSAFLLLSRAAASKCLFSSVFALLFLNLQEENKKPILSQVFGNTGLSKHFNDNYQLELKQEREIIYMEVENTQEPCCYKTTMELPI